MAVFKATYPLWSPSLLSQSLSDIPKLQSKKKLYHMLEYFPMTATFECFISFLLMTFTFLPYNQALFYWFGVSMTMFTREVLANAYAIKPPFMFSDKIEATCTSTYGAPNGQVMVASYTLVTAYLHKYYEIDTRRLVFRSVMCTGYIVKMVATSAIIFYLIMLSFSQLAIGIASYDQVLLGLILGVYMALVLHFKVKIVFKYLQVIFASKSEHSGFGLVWKILKGDKDYKIEVASAFKIGFGQILATVGLFVMLPMFVAALASIRIFTSDLEQYDKESEMNCVDQSQDLTARSLQLKTLSNTKVLALCYGSILGAMFNMRFSSRFNLRQSDWNRTTFMPTIKRLFIVLVWLTISIVFNIWFQEKVGMVLFVNQIGLFVLAFGLFGFSQFFLSNCKAVNEESKGTLVQEVYSMCTSFNDSNNFRSKPRQSLPLEYIENEDLDTSGRYSPSKK